MELIVPLTVGLSVCLAGAAALAWMWVSLNRLHEEAEGLIREAHDELIRKYLADFERKMIARKLERK